MSVRVPKGLCFLSSLAISLSLSLSFKKGEEIRGLGLEKHSTPGIARALQGMIAGARECQQSSGGDSFLADLGGRLGRTVWDTGLMGGNSYGGHY